MASALFSRLIALFCLKAHTFLCIREMKKETFKDEFTAAQGDEEANFLKKIIICCIFEKAMA